MQADGFAYANGQKLLEALEHVCQPRSGQPREHGPERLPEAPVGPPINAGKGQVPLRPAEPLDATMSKAWRGSDIPSRQHADHLRRRVRSGAQGRRRGQAHVG